jgi:hypothetical protein
MTTSAGRSAISCTFFSSPAAADAWTAQHTRMFWLPVPEAAEVGRRLAARAFAATSVD